MISKKSTLPQFALSLEQARTIELARRKYVGRDQAIADRLQALPLYSGWALTIGIRSDGIMLAWNDLGELTWEPLETVFIRVSILRLARMDELFEPLIPLRPSDAIDCNMCGGTGKFQFPAESLAGVICQCGGWGWLANNQLADGDCHRV